jgi:carbon starvation protein
VNALYIVCFVLLLFAFGYFVYAKKISALLGVKPERKTPAHTNYDGVDYVPAKHWTMLFGHHFASIAGAAPVIGPVLALSIWGWAPTVLWIALGTVFIGGVHDFSSLMISVKHKASSTADIAEQAISKNAKIIFLSFVWLTLILIIAVFVHYCAKTLVEKPEIVIPSIGLIPLALVVGFLLYVRKLHQPTVTVFAVLVLICLIFLGDRLPIALGGNALHTWSIILLVYAFLASVTPVQILLQPRDYLSAYLLFFGILFGFGGIVITRPDIHYPAFITWSKGAGFELWPVLFVTVACGAISGFHSIVASGTTSKQLASERHAKGIGYGGMIAEGLLAAMALLVVAAAFGSPQALGKIVSQGGGPVAAFGIGYGRVTDAFLGGFGALFAIIVLNAFILTTLDTATRIGRYITQELFKIKNRYAATIIVVALSALLVITKEYNEIWPIFGSANQLIAALTLIVITSWLLARKKKVLYTLIPAVFMLVTTAGALILKIVHYIKDKEHYLLLAIASVLLALAVFVMVEAGFEIKRIIKKERALPGT